MELLRRAIEHLRSRDRSERITRSYSGDPKVLARWFYETNGEELTPKSITPIDLRGYKRFLLRDRGSKSGIVNRRLARISAFCRWAQDDRLADGNPCGEISVVPEARTARKWPSKREQYTLMRAVQKANGPREEALMILMLHGVLRVREASGLRIGDISVCPRNGEIIVGGGKGEKFGTVPQNLEVRKALKAYLSVRRGVSHDYLFVGQKGEQLKPHGIHQLVRK